MEKKLKQAARYEMMISKEDHSLSCDQNEKITSFCKSKNSFLKTHIIGITHTHTHTHTHLTALFLGLPG